MHMIIEHINGLNPSLNRLNKEEDGGYEAPCSLLPTSLHIQM